MTNIQPIDNGELGLPVRLKINAAITEANKVTSKADLSPDDGNYRFKNGTDFQLRETGPTPGWRTVWLVNGALQTSDTLDET